jgi:DNA invertase Pin-like site-specific DNA recombinase
MKAVVAYCRSACAPQCDASNALASASALRDARPEISHVYMDAGESGISLERPALQRLIGDCLAGKIAAVVVRDAARLSRDRDRLAALLRIIQDAGVHVEFAAGADPLLDLGLSASSFTGTR